MVVIFQRAEGGFTKALSPSDQASVDAETERIKTSREGPGARQHPFKAARWTHKNGHPRCRVCGAEQHLPDGFDTTGVDMDDWPTAPCEGYKPVTKHGDKGDAGYLALHPNAARPARRRYSPVAPLIERTPDPAHVPEPPPVVKRPVLPMPLDVRPSERQLMAALKAAVGKFIRDHGGLPISDEEKRALVQATVAKASKPFPPGTERGVRAAWDDVVGDFPEVGDWVNAVRPGSRMGRGVLGETSFSEQYGSDISIRRDLPRREQAELLEGMGGVAPAVPTWDPDRVAQGVMTHELGHALWFSALWHKGPELPEVPGQTPAKVRLRDANRRVKGRPPGDIVAPSTYGTQDAGEHFAEVFTVTRMFREQPPPHMASSLGPGVWPRMIEQYDRYVASVADGSYFRLPPPRRFDIVSGMYVGGGRAPSLTKAVHHEEDDVQVISDTFGLDDLTDEELDLLGLLNEDEDNDDDEPVVFVRTADAFTKAIRRPWREELHPRGFGGRFGSGSGQRRHGAGTTIDPPSGLGRRDRILQPRVSAPKQRLGLQEVPVGLIHAGNNDRKEFDPAKLSELARSIDQDGIAFPPVVRPHPTKPGEFEIVGGERRVRAMRDVLGWDKVPVNVKALTDEQASMLMLAENTVRDDLKPVDEARGYKTRMDQFGLTPEELAARTKMPVRRINERLDLLRLEPQIQDLVNAGQFPLGHARLMRDLDANRQRTAMQTYNSGTKGGGTMTVATFRQVVAKLQNEQDQQGLGFDMGSFFVNEDVDAEARAAAAAAEAAAAKRAKNRETILSMGEIATRFDAKPATVQQWRSRGHLPPPDTVVSKMPLWYESTLDGWKPPGRVRKMLDWLRTAPPPGNLDAVTVKVRRVDLPILRALVEAKRYTLAQGVGGQSVTKSMPAVAVIDGEAVPLRPYSMELLAGSVLTVSTPDGDTYLDVEKCDCQGDGFEIVDTADGEGGVAFTIDGSRVLWAPTAKAFGEEALGAALVFTDAEVGEEVTFPSGFTGQPWPASDAGQVFLRPEMPPVAKAGVMAGARRRWEEAKHPRGFGGKFGQGGGVKKPTAGPQRAPAPLRAGKAPNVAGNLPGGPPQAPKAGAKMDPSSAVPPADMQIDSLGKHGGPGGLTPERKALHDAIVAEHLKGHEASPNPEATFLGGGPAAGKSTVLGSAPPKGVIIDSDHIKSMLPEYQQMIDASDANAAGYVHEESSLLAKRIQSEAADKSLDLTLDGTGDSSIEKLRSKVNEARQAGQSTKGLYVTVDTEEAVRRAEVRGQKTGRVVPSSVIRDTHAMVSRTLPKAISEDLFDELTLWDTSTTPPTLIGEKKKGGKWGIHDAEAWQRFVDKGTEVAKAAGAAGPESEFTGEDAIRMLRAIVADQTLEEAGVPDTPTHRARWDAYAADVAKIKAAGQVVEIPYDWTMTPDDDAPGPGTPGQPPPDAPTPPVGGAKPTVAKAAAGPPSEVDPVKRYTLGPLYPAAPHRVTREDLDAHEEFVTAADLQESVWDYTKSGDRKIRLQHGSDTLIIGEWVELMCMPAPVTVDLALPGGETITKSFAAGTPFMGVIWTNLGWELVEKGLIRGYSFGGSAAKMIVELER